MFKIVGYFFGLILVPNLCYINCKPQDESVSTFNNKPELTSDSPILADEEDIGIKVTEILDSITKNYDKRVRPNYGRAPVTVGVTLYVIAFHAVNEAKMEFTFDMYFRQHWKDPRLAFNSPGINNISMGPDFIETIWNPDTFFVNEKKSELDNSISNQFMRLSENGDILRSARITVTASCPMDLTYFPMDKQLCSLTIESYGNTMLGIEYEWQAGSKSVGISHEVTLPQFRVIGYRQNTDVISMAQANYSRLSCEFQFERLYPYYVIQVYFPAGLMVIVSWAAFWLNRSSTGERLTIAVTTVLTITLLWTSTNAALPPISYIKAIDVYLGMCFAMVFASLIETAGVGYITKRLTQRRDCSSFTDYRYERVPRSPVPSKSKTCCLRFPWLIDMCSRIGFPLAFIAFNFAYWEYYLNVSKTVEDGFILLHKE